MKNRFVRLPSPKQHVALLIEEDSARKTICTLLSTAGGHEVVIGFVNLSRAPRHYGPEPTGLWCTVGMLLTWHRTYEPCRGVSPN